MSTDLHQAGQDDSVPIAGVLHQTGNRLRTAHRKDAGTGHLHLPDGATHDRQSKEEGISYYRTQ